MSDELSRCDLGAMEPTDFLYDAVLGHGELCRRVGDWAVLDKGRMRGVVNTSSHAGSYSTRFDAIVELPDGRQMMESFVGRGDSPQEATGEAYGRFLQGAFHVILAALLGHRCEQVEGTSLMIGGMKRVVLDCGAQIRSGTPTDGREILSWHELYEDNLKLAELSPAMHWYRIFVAQNQGRIISKECLLDNEPWEHGMRWIDAHAWPMKDDFYSVRMFVMIV